MAKVVLVWNEHPTEVVAGFHARKVAQILREKYGHEVVMEKIPVAETNYGILRRTRSWLLGKGTSARETAKRLIALKDSWHITAEKTEEHNTFAFNFHATPAQNMGNATTLAPQEFQLKESDLLKKMEDEHGTHAMPEIELCKAGEKTYTVEVPGFYTNLPKKIFETNQKRLKRVRKAYGGRNIPLLRIMRVMAQTDQYFFQYTPLRHPAQQKYKDDSISEKIAAAIHERITKK